MHVDQIAETLNMSQHNSSLTSLSLVSASTLNLEFWNLSYVNQIAETVEIKARQEYHYYQFHSDSALSQEIYL